MSMSSVETKNIRYGVVLSYLGLLVSLLGTLFISNRILNYIGDYNYGLYSFVSSITSWLTVVSSALCASYLRFATIEHKLHRLPKVNSIYYKLLLGMGGLVLLVGSFVTILLFFLKVNWGDYSWADSKLMYALFAVSILNISISIPSMIFSLFITFKQRFVFQKFLSIFTTVINFAGMFLIAFLTRNVLALSSFSLVITIITLACNAYYCRKEISIQFEKTSFRENRDLVAAVIAFSGILILNSVVDQINSGVDKTLLGIYSIPENVTIYQMGQQFNTYLALMSVAVSGVFSPKIHALVSNADYLGINSLYLKISKIQSMVLSLIVFGFIACGKDFIIWWIGEQRLNAYYVGAILMLIDLCPLTMNASVEIQRAENRHRFRAYVYLLVAIVNVSLSIVFVRILPKEHAVFACLAGSVIARVLSHWIAMNIYNYKVIKLNTGKYMLTLLKYVLIGMACSLVVMYIKNLFICSIQQQILKVLIEGGVFTLLYVMFVLISDFGFISSLITRR